MYGMFQSTLSFNQPLNTWDTSNVTNMGYLFENDPAFNQPLNHWVTSHVTNMGAMFYGDTMFDQDISSWDTSNVTDMSYMFKNATNFNQSLNTWNVGNVTTTSGMFANASAFQQPLNLWNVSHVTDMSSMFKNDSLPNLDISSWNVSSVTTMANFFQIGSGGLSTANYTLLLQAWSQESLHPGVTFFAGASKYCPSAVASRANIISTYSWGILDGGASSCSHTVEYIAGPGGSILGNASQEIPIGTTGTAVSALPNSGYRFVNWSDGSLQNPRTDANIVSDLVITANFVANENQRMTGGQAYVCTDPRATNYHTYATAGNIGCSYRSGSQSVIDNPVANQMLETKPFQFLNNLKQGQRSSDVIKLQKFLNGQGDLVAQTGVGSPGNESTLFGLRTKQALIKFQKAHAIAATGFFGPKTRSVVNGYIKPSN